MTWHEDLDLTILKSFRRNLPSKVASDMRMGIARYITGRRYVVDLAERDWVNPEAFANYRNTLEWVWDNIGVNFDLKGTVWLYLPWDESSPTERDACKAEFNNFVDYLVNEIPILRFVYDGFKFGDDAPNIPLIQAEDFRLEIRVAV